MNAAAHGVANVVVREADLFAGVAGGFDLIVANPPYLPDPQRRLYRHGGGALGAAVSLRMAAAALERLAVGGSLVLYTGSAIVDGQDALLAALRPLLAGEAFAWTYRELDPDVFGEELGGGALAGADRIAAVLLEVTRRCA